MNEAAIIVSLTSPSFIDEDGMGFNPDLEKRIYHTIRELRISGVHEIIVVITYKSEPLRRKLWSIGVSMVKESPKNNLSEAELYRVGRDNLKNNYNLISRISINV